MSMWPRARRPADPASTAVLAELDQVLAGLQAAGLDDWAAGAQLTAAWVRDAGVDSVVLIRLSSYRKVLEAAAAGWPAT
jgi:hypothetical protein